MSGTITVSNRESVSLFSTQTNLTNRSLGTTRRDGTIALAGELAICANTFAERSSYESILSANARRRPDHLAGRSNAGEQSTDSGTLYVNFSTSSLMPAMILTAPALSSSVSDLHGMTLSSVSSLTVSPEPVVQFNLQVPSRTSQTLHESGFLALHILPPVKESVRLARAFSRGTQGKRVTRPFEELGKDEWSYFTTETLRIPVLSLAERILICEKHQVFRVYNHELWTCRVREIVRRAGDADATGGLLYFNRRFHAVGGKLEH
ncbi:hypothetical protein KL911_001486 [Ogataea haglerorum]|uniref:uncharacterized protein n=1 Tax=Ogataea haglerorum TaxID=1937702 RepID=UPI001C8963BD|nr:uncharacterized protein KL911_001486 [Ogataea haglerorum]KAG7756684.1 hypothetical protein KL911_001486 [Ogataea haglerorum]